MRFRVLHSGANLAATLSLLICVTVYSQNLRLVDNLHEPVAEHVEQAELVELIRAGEAALLPSSSVTSCLRPHLMLSMAWVRMSEEARDSGARRKLIWPI